MGIAAANRMEAANYVQQQEPADEAPLPYNPQTGFATDFLNQYNELTMTLELIPDMPDLFAEFADWSPNSYKAHFENSGFQYKDVIIEAYEQANPELKNSFDSCVASLNAVALTALTDIGVAIEDGAESDMLTRLSQDALDAMRSQLTLLNQIIHGTITTADQAAVDALLADGDEPNSQAAIDALFD